MLLRLWCSLKWMTESYRQQLDPDPQVGTNTNTMRLSDLSPELIVLIASILSTQSAACLSLCNRAMSQILGPDVWRCSNMQNPEVRASFLSILSKDLPQYFVCFRCIRLHASSAVQWFRTTPKTLTRCLGNEAAFEPASDSVLYIRFPHIQLAMKRHRLGPSHGCPLEAFQSSVVRESDSLGNIVLSSTDALIVSNELLLRSQQWVLLPHNRRDELWTRRVIHHLCNHIWSRGKESNNLQTLIKNRLDLLEEQGQCRTSVAQCLKCPMDYILDVVDLGKRGVASCLTKWINLGAGSHPTDPKWRSHLIKSLPRDVTYESHTLGSIRSSFESQLTALSFQNFTARNLDNLLSRRDRKPISWRTDKIYWKLVSRGLHAWSLENWDGTLIALVRIYLILTY